MSFGSLAAAVAATAVGGWFLETGFEYVLVLETGLEYESVLETVFKTFMEARFRLKAQFRNRVSKLIAEIGV